MLDIKQIREKPQVIEKLLQKKDPSISLTDLLELDTEIRKIKTKVEHIKSERNKLSKEIGFLKQNGKDCDQIMKKVGGLGEDISQLDASRAPLEEKFKHKLSYLPNIPMDEIKVSNDPKENVIIKVVGEKPQLTNPLNHLEIGEKLNLFDFQRGAKVSGSRWPIYRGLGARLELALINFMLDINIKNGFQLHLPPLLIKKEMMFGAAQLPKFEDQLFKLKDDDHYLYLIPTAEAVLNGLHYDEILDEKCLPIKYVAYTPCFRREAGAAGAQERGLIRMHQFNKVEMFCLSKPEDSETILDQMMDNAEEILQKLGLHYRNALLVTGDMSFASAKTIDLEVWLPGQNRYYEVSSISTCTDFQARRSQIRFRRNDHHPEFVHTLNGSGLATSRLMVALLENNQQSDGSVKIPKALQPYLGGITKLCQ